MSREAARARTSSDPPPTAPPPLVCRERWVTVCAVDRLLPGVGVCARVDGQQVALFCVDNRVYAIGNHDPFSGANVLSRGIVGDRRGVLKVASPIYKQSFALETGQCLDDATVRVPVYATRVVDGAVEIGPRRENP
jgi:nitrite reductase (NADH) small subunit